MEVVGTMFCLYQARVVMCMCASGIYFASVSTLHVKSLELFQQCGNFSISFSVYNIECFRDKNMSVYTLINPEQKNTNKVDMSRKCRLCETWFKILLICQILLTRSQNIQSYFTTYYETTLLCKDTGKEIT